MNIGQRIKYFRNKINMAQVDLAELADMDATNINRIENDKVTPHLDSLLKICSAIGVTPNDLLLFEYNAPKEALNAGMANLMADCSQEEYKKIIEYIHFVKLQRK